MFHVFMGLLVPHVMVFLLCVEQQEPFHLIRVLKEESTEEEKIYSEILFNRFTEMANNVDLQIIKPTQFHIIYLILEIKSVEKGRTAYFKRMCQREIFCMITLDKGSKKKFPK